MATGPVVPDVCVGWVVDALARRGAGPLVLDSGAFPTSVRLSTDGRSGRIHTPDWSVDSEELASVWLRYVDVGAGAGEAIHPDFREAALVQSEIAFWGFLSGLSTPMVDRPARLRAAPEHVEQLGLARQAGLAVPRTVITNDPAEVRALQEVCPGGIVAKMLHSSSVRLRAADGHEGYVPTRRLEPDEPLDGLELCPMIFQEYVPKALDIRVVSVGRSLFGAAVDPRLSTIGAVDWRQDRSLAGRFQRWQPDSATEAAIQRMFDHGGLEYNTMDLVQRPDGEVVFLELNGVSFYDFVEEATGLPISETLAGLLVGEAPTRFGGRS